MKGRINILKIVHLAHLELKPDRDDQTVYLGNKSGFTLKDPRRVSEINRVLGVHREELLPLLKGMGAGLYAIEVKEQNTALDRLGAMITGRLPETPFLHTLVEVKPKDLMAALRIAKVFGWETNLDYAEFEAVSKSGETCEYMVYTEDKLIEILEGLKQENENG